MDKKKKPEPDSSLNKNKLLEKDQLPDSYGSGNAFEETESPIEDNEKELSDEQLDELLSDD